MTKERRTRTPYCGSDSPTEITSRKVMLKTDKDDHIPFPFAVLPLCVYPIEKGKLGISTLKLAGTKSQLI